MTPGHTATALVSTRSRTCVQQCGVSLSADAAVLAGSRAVATRLNGQVSELLQAGTPVALRIAGIGGRGALRRFYGTCLGVRDAFRRAGIDPTRLEVTLGAASVPLYPAWRIRRELLGNGVLNVTFDSDPPTDLSDDFWRDLWRLRSAPVRSHFWPGVRSACMLLSPERGAGVVPGIGLQAPEQSAWQRAEFELTSFANGAGSVDIAELAAAIGAAMDEADRRYDTADWSTSKMQHDAWYNRRLAIVPTGIGDIARVRGLDPERHESLAELRKLLGRIRAAVRAHSRASAMHNERLPSIAATNPCLHLPAGAREACWQRHWHSALDRHALRHRNLLVLSPWSLMPRGLADFRYANFLPLLEAADACEFHRSVSLDAWSVEQLKLFHCRAWALNDKDPCLAVVADRP